MRITYHKFGKQVTALVILLTAALVISSATSALAKGAQRGSSSGDSRGGQSDQPSYRSGSSSESRSESRSTQRYESPSTEHRSESRSESRSETRYEPPKHDNPPPPPPPPSQGNSSTQRYKGSDESRSSSRESNPHSDRTQDTRYQPSNDSHSNNNPPASDRSEGSSTGIYAPQRHKGSDESRPSGNTQQNSNQAPPTTYRPAPSSDSRSTGESSSRDTRVDNRAGVQLPDRIKGRDESRSGSSSTSTPTIRSSGPDASSRQSSTSNTRGISTLGVYRKEHADLATIWKERTERRDTRSDSWTRYDQDKSRSHSGVHVNINVFPCTYRYYAYDYDPWRCYPSVYCYYGGLFPPFINHTRVIIVHHTPVVYHYVDLPLATIYCDLDDNDYYLANYRHRYLSGTLRDIERAWERSEPGDLIDHTRRSWRVDVFLKEDYAYTLNWEDFREMTEDAMDHIQTVDFEFYKVRQRDRDEVVAYAKHNYYDYDYRDYRERRDAPEFQANVLRMKQYKTVYVRYTLQRDDDEWYITEVGSAPYRL